MQERIVIKKKKTDTEILTDLQVLAPLNIKTWFLECRLLSVRMFDGWMDERLASA
jgi:hypothetical protein